VDVVDDDAGTEARIGSLMRIFNDCWGSNNGVVLVVGARASSDLRVCMSFICFSFGSFETSESESPADALGMKRGSGGSGGISCGADGDEAVDPVE